jgi:hypothetical protein
MICDIKKIEYICHAYLKKLKTKKENSYEKSIFISFYDDACAVCIFASFS